jgi:hypothetical protein
MRRAILRRQSHLFPANLGLYRLPFPAKSPRLLAYDQLRGDWDLARRQLRARATHVHPMHVRPLNAIATDASQQFFIR